MAKGMDTFAPMSQPVRFDGRDLGEIDLRLSVNGVVRQSASASAMTHPPERIIAYVSRYMTLEPGDVIATGTPPGVGPLSDGDVVEAAADGVGSVSNKVRRE